MNNALKVFADNVIVIYVSSLNINITSIYLRALVNEYKLLEICFSNIDIFNLKARDCPLPLQTRTASPSFCSAFLQKKLNTN